MKAAIGLMVEGQFGLNWDRWTRVLDMAERAGYQCVFRSDHFTNPAEPDLDSLELFTSLTYAATRTKRIEFGSLVAPVTFRHPTMTVRQAAAIDDLSNGRLVLGLGAGWQRREHENYGIPFDDFPTRFNKLTDALEITRRLLHDAKPVTHAGKTISVHDAVLLPRPKRKTPILIGGNGPKRSLPLAAKYADEWNGVFLDADAYRARNTQLDRATREERARSEIGEAFADGAVRMGARRRRHRTPRGVHRCRLRALHAAVHRLRQPRTDRSRGPPTT